MSARQKRDEMKSLVPTVIHHCTTGGRTHNYNHLDHIPTHAANCCWNLHLVLEHYVYLRLWDSKHVVMT